MSTVYFILHVLHYTPTSPNSTADLVHLVGKPSTTFDNRGSSISDVRAVEHTLGTHIGHYVIYAYSFQIRQKRVV
jgi:hypothetical protein